MAHALPATKPNGTAHRLPCVLLPAAMLLLGVTMLVAVAFLDWAAQGLAETDRLERGRWLVAASWAAVGLILLAPFAAYLIRRRH